MLFTEEPPRADFEIVLHMRDQHGLPTGKKVSFSSNDGSKIAEFYDKHEAMMEAIQSKKKKRRSRKGKKAKDQNVVS